MRNALAHAGKSGRRVVSAFIAFAQDDTEAATAQWRKVADQLRPKLPKLAGFLEEAETDVLAYMTFPPQRRTKLHSTDEMDKRCLHGRGDDCGDRRKSILLFGRAAGHSSVPATDLAAAARQGRSRLTAFAATAWLGLDRPEHDGTLVWNGTGFLAWLDLAVSRDYGCWARATSWRSVTRRLQA